MSWVLSCNQYSLKQTVPNRLTFHQKVRCKTCVLRDAIRTADACLPHHCGTAVSALATQRSSGKGANGGHGPRRGARCAESIALALEPGQVPRVPTRCIKMKDSAGPQLTCSCNGGERSTTAC